ncbi:MAG: hypothetical protein WDO24_14530 [Pseudomonadota bacterium]
MSSAFQDKRYAGRALQIDLMDTMVETRRWSKLQLILEAAPIGLQQGDVQEGRNLTGVFTFEGQKSHGMFEAVIVKPDSDDDLLVVNFEWISERGSKLLRTMASERKPAESGEQPTMTVAFTRSTASWSLSGFLLDNYHGSLRPGERFQGLIWMDKPQDPGCFDAHATGDGRHPHTLSAKFDELPKNTFALLESTINKGRAALARNPAHS